MSMKKKEVTTWTATCTRCGRQQEASSVSTAHAHAAALEGFGRLRWAIEHQRFSSGNNPENDWDLCFDCSNELDAWLHGVDNRIGGEQAHEPPKE